MDTSQSTQQTPIALIGKIFTSNLQNKWAEVVIYQADTITFVGSLADAQQHLTPSTKIVKIPEDHLILPGFIDTHMHPLAGGLQLLQCPLEVCSSLKQIQDRLSPFTGKSSKKSEISAKIIFFVQSFFQFRFFLF